MSRIDDMIRQMCPDGVDYQELGRVAVLRRGTAITKKDVEEGDIPVIAGGTKPAYFVATSNRSGVTIVVAGSGAYAGHVSYWDIPIFVSDAFSIQCSEDVLIPRFCYHFLKSKQEVIHALKRGGGVPHVYAKDVAKILVPVVPVEIQQEIVRVLDQFTQLEAELEAELEARRKQYAYYRESLIPSPSGGSRHVRWRELRDLGSFYRGKRFTKNDYSDQGIPCIHYGEIYTRYGVWVDRAESYLDSMLKDRLRFALPGDVIITDVGETVEDVGSSLAWLGSMPVAIHDHCFAYRSEFDARFLSHLMGTSWFRHNRAKYVARTKVKTLLIDSFARIKVPDIPFEEQRRIADALDRFDTLVNDLSSGLPAEITARRKQYEYYRDRLLTFPEMRS